MQESSPHGRLWSTPAQGEHSKVTTAQVCQRGHCLETHALADVLPSAVPCRRSSSSVTCAAGMQRPSH